MTGNPDKPDHPIRPIEPPSSAGGQAQPAQTAGPPPAGRPAQQRRKKELLPPWLRTTLAVLFGTLRILMVPLLCIGALFVGLTIGYAVIGDGNAADVWKLSTWKHLYDLVFEGT